VKVTHKVFIATSLDGYIADEEGGIEWLDTFPEINEVDTGYHSFMEKIDAMVMGRATFEKVLSFNVPWPYSVPVFVLSNSMASVPEGYEDKIQITKGTPHEISDQLLNEGHHQIYVDGGQVIQAFLEAGLIDEMVITTIPIMLGRGIPLFGQMEQSATYCCVETKLFFEKVAQNKYVKVSM